MTRLLRFGLPGLVFTALTLAATTRVAAQDPCRQDDPPPPPECWMVDVTPDGGTAGPHTPNTGGYSVEFTIANIGMNGDGYSISCAGAGNVTCTGTSVSPTSVPLAAGAQTTATATYNVGNPGTGTLTLTATGTSASDNGSFSVPVLAYGVAVTPDGGAESGRPKNTSGYGASFTVQN